MSATDSLFQFLPLSSNWLWIPFLVVVLVVFAVGYLRMP